MPSKEFYSDYKLPVPDQTYRVTDNFTRLNAVLKEFEVKDHLERPFLNVKMIDLNRTTLPLYKRLDEKNVKALTETERSNKREE